MKNVKYLIILLSLITFSSCEKEEEDTLFEESNIYLENAFAEIYQLNNISATPHSQDESVNSVTNQINISSFNGINLSSFNTRVAAPIDNSVSINAALESVFIVLKNGEQVPPFFANGEVGSILEFEGIQRQEFLFSFTYPSNANPIEIGDIASLNLNYSFDYSNNASGNNIYTKTISHIVYFEGGNGNGNSCDQEISAVNYSNISFGDACGSPSSIRLYYTNNSNISIRVRFTVVDESGVWSGQNLGFILDPGETTNQHFCYPKIVNNQFCYQILIKSIDSSCEFPDADNIPVCDGF